MAQPAQPAAQPTPFSVEPPNFKELAPGAPRSCAFYEKTLVRRVFTVGMWIFTAVFAVATSPRYGITALKQTQARFALVALAVVDIVLLYLPKSKNDPTVRLQMRRKVDDLVLLGDSLNIANRFAEEIKNGTITADEVKRAVLIEVKDKGLKAMLLNDAKRPGYLAQLLTYKKELQQLFEAELATSTLADFCYKHGDDYALSFWDDDQAKGIFKTLVINNAIRQSVTLSNYKFLGYPSICEKIPNYENELVNALVDHYVAQFDADRINYQDLREKIGFSRIEAAMGRDSTLKGRLKIAALQSKTGTFLEDTFARDRKVLGITFQESLAVLPQEVVKAYREKLIRELKDTPANIPDKREQMNALGITCKSVFLERWNGDMWTVRLIMADLGSLGSYGLKLLEKPREFKAVFTAAMSKSAAVGEEEGRFINVMAHYPQLFEIGVFTPEDQDVVEQINADLLNLANYQVALGMLALSACYEMLKEGFVKAEVTETLLQRYFLVELHLHNLCHYGFTFKKRQLFENTEVGKIILEISAEAKTFRETVPLKDGKLDPAAMDPFIETSRAKLMAFKIKQGQP